MEIQPSKHNYDVVSNILDDEISSVGFNYIASCNPEIVAVKDGRNVAFRMLGDKNGVPIVKLHGNPGSSLAPHVHEEDIRRAGVRIIALDRAGYGGSDRHPELRISDTASDVIDVMDAIGYRNSRFGVLANSGGAPHALGIAALYPERVSGLFIASGLSPDESGVWNTAMSEDNQRSHKAAKHDHKILWEYCQRIAHETQSNSSYLWNSLLPTFEFGDSLALASEGLAKAIVMGHKDGLRSGAGWYDDIVAIHLPWGFSVEDIQAPTIVWHGSADPFGNIAHSRWLSDRIPDSTLIESPEESHFSFWFHAYHAVCQLRDWQIGSAAATELRNREGRRKQQFIDEFRTTWDVSPFARSGEPVDAVVQQFDGSYKLLRDIISRQLLRLLDFDD